MILEEFKNIKSEKHDLKKFGVTIGIAFIIISTIPFFYKGSFFIWFGIIGIIMIGAGIFYPSILFSIQKIWMMLSIILGWIMTRIILILLYFLVFTPIGIISKLFRKKYLSLKRASSESYWQAREKTTSQPENYERQY